jgi:hypothetical protein
MSGHVVVPVEPCKSARHPCPTGVKPGWCDGCLGDGRRAVLDDAVPVGRAKFDGKASRAQLWQEVPR